MTALSQSTRRKLSLLQLAEELGNVSKACRIMGYHRDNPTLKGGLPKDDARPALDKTRLGELIGDAISQNLGSRPPADGIRAAGS